MSASSDNAARPAAVLDFTPDVTWAARSRWAYRDVMEAARLWRLCWMLGWLDIKLKYRGSVLGPFWLTLSTAVMVAAMGGIYATLFRMNLHEYLPFLTLSLVLWGFVGAVVNEGCNSFVQQETMIRSERMPYTVYAVRIVLRLNFAIAWSSRLASFSICCHRYVVESLGGDKYALVVGLAHSPALVQICGDDSDHAHLAPHNLENV